MKWVTFAYQDGRTSCGWIKGDKVVDMHEASGGKLPKELLSFLRQRAELWPIVEDLLVEDLLKQEKQSGMIPLDQVKIMAPLPNPSSFRDFYAFENHVVAAHRRRDAQVAPEWYEFPVFYFSNHQSIIGPDTPVKRPAVTQWLDYELEVACVIGKEGINIPAAQAESYIFGYCILNDWSARDIQRKEVRVGLGPHKGKDFATSMGPWIVTPDELLPYRQGDRYQLAMTASVNGKLLSQGNLSDLYYSFGQMIERASADVMLYPGDIIGTGTVGTGCILELGTETHRWLEPGDQVELEVTEMGKLRNTIV